MFRNVLNGYVRKAFDYLKIDENENGGNGSSNNNQETTQPITSTTRSTSSTSLTTQRDHNNNNLVEHIRKQHRQKQEGLHHQPAAAAIIGTNSSLQPQPPQTEQNQHHSHPHPHKKYSQYSLIDEFDWFKPFKESPLSGSAGENQPREEEEDEDEDESLFDASITSSSLSVTGYHRGGRLHHHHRHFDIKFESYYDYLTKFYSASNMANQTRTLDEYLASASNDFDLPEPETAQTNGSSSNLRACRLFQKAYYREQPIRGEQVTVPSWRMKEKMKTVSAALVLCLNIGVDPPDVVKPAHCSKLECWINPMTATPQKALESIGAELQKQYERWQPRARYKQSLDPTTDDVKKLCASLRRNAKDDRVLFHYNGHGVPKPTVNGEIWVFNKEFTQYIPLSLYEVQTWMGVPSLYVWDCSSAGLIIQSFLQFEEDRENELLQRNARELDNTSGTGGANNTPSTPSTPGQTTGGTQSNSQSLPKLRDSIHLAACSANEILPMHSPDLPYDIFTACLTTPIKTALYWYVSQRMGRATAASSTSRSQSSANVKQMIPGLTLDMLDRIPGQINDRRTMMGELNWIFTAITDTIAWNVLDSDMFQKLFRQDLLVASLFRNFLLAERIMKSLDCTPVSHPPLPSTNEHPLWQAWDLALDMCISQLPGMLAGGGDPNQPPREFVSCGFFTEQIEIFDAWLKYNVNSSTCPEQLPVVLQVLLSVHHRLKALELLAKFIDMGPWAVSAALSVGIFPYVLKLLSTQPKELRSLLTFIWAKILAVDKSCQAELVKDNGHAYFIHILPEHDVPPIQKVYSAFVLSCLVDNYPTGQESAKQNHLIAICAYLLTEKQSRDYESPLLRQWVCICLGLSWQNYPEARWEGVRCNAHQSLLGLINDPVAEVRAAAIFALGTYIGCGQGNEATVEMTNKIDSEIVSALIKEYDMVYIVRKELIVALFNYINQFVNQQQQQQPTHHHPQQQPSQQQQPQQPQNGLVNGMNHDLTRQSSSNTLYQNAASQKENTTPLVNGERVLSAASLANSALPKSQSTSALTRTGSATPLSANQQQQTQQQSQKTATTTPTSNNPISSTSDYSSGGSTFSPTAVISTPTTVSSSTNLTRQTPSITGGSNSLLANNSVNSLFIRVWNLIIDMQSDPHPEVAELAQRVFSYFHSQLSLFDASKQKIITDLLKLKQVKPPPPPTSHSLPAMSTGDGKHHHHHHHGGHHSHHVISTEFVPWCCKYFLKPLLSAKTSTTATAAIGGLSAAASSPAITHDDILETSSKVDIYSAEILDQHCKLLYNQKRRKTPRAWSEPREMDEICQIKHTSLPVHVKFHPTEEHLVFVVDRDAHISLYETQNRTKCLQFSLLKYQQHMLATPARTKSAHQGLLVTSFKIVNAQHEPILLVGTDDYVVRFFKPDLIGFKATNTQLVTSFNAINESSRRPSTKESGLVLEWDEQREMLMCAGDTNFIRVWDMHKELYKEYPTEANSGVTSLTTSENFTVAGFGDGSLRLFDFRCPSSSSIGSRSTAKSTGPPFYQHESFVLKVKLNKRNTTRLVSAGLYGGVNIFDLRAMRSELESNFNREYVTALECHPVNDLIAVGNGAEQNQSIKIYDYRGRELSQIKHHDGFMGKRIATVSCLDWSSYKNEIVFGGNDNYLTVFSCREPTL